MRSVLNLEQQAKMLVLLEKMKDRPEVNIFQLWGIKKIQKKKKPTDHEEDKNPEIVEEEEDGLLESDNEEQEECMTPRKDGKSRDYIPEISESTAQNLVGALMMTNSIGGD
jgi:hypothetical protein